MQKYTAAHNRNMKRGVVNPLKVCFNIGGTLAPKIFERIASAVLLPFTEPVMRPYRKSQERSIMQKLMRRRERQTPEHVSPAWLSAYWRQVAR